MRTTFFQSYEYYIASVFVSLSRTKVFQGILVVRNPRRTKFQLIFEGLFPLKYELSINNNELNVSHILPLIFPKNFKAVPFKFVEYSEIMIPCWQINTLGV